MKAIVCHLSGPKGPRTTLALLDGISAAIVTNSWRSGSTSDPKHKWCKETYAAYRAIIEQLEKYWVLAIVHTSTRFPTHTLSPFTHTRKTRMNRAAPPQHTHGTPHHHTHTYTL
jgi:hypothetical protein